MKDGDCIVLYKYFPVMGPMSEQKLKWFCEGRVLVSPPMYLNDPSEMYYCQAPMTADDCRERLLGTATDIERSSIVANYHIGQAIKGRVDPAYEAKRLQELISAEAGVLSLTEKPLSRVLWAHYADGHMGFVAGFIHKYIGKNFIEGIPYEAAWGPFGIAFKVDYIDPLPPMSRNSKNAVRVFCTKHMEWSHEAEWRVICYYGCAKMNRTESLSREPLIIEKVQHEDGNTYFQLAFRPEELKCILLGTRSQPGLADKLQAFLGAAPHCDVNIHKVEYNPGSRDIAINGSHL